MLSRSAILCWMTSRHDKMVPGSFTHICSKLPSVYERHHHHYSPELARGRRATQPLRFLSFSHSSPAAMPLSASSCLTQVFRGRPWGLVQSGLGLDPEHTSTLSLRAMWSGTSAESLLIWSKREWRLPAMMSLISERRLLSETVKFVTICHYERHQRLILCNQRLLWSNGISLAFQVDDQKSMDSNPA